jgi:F420-dependent oxidoreductase-like protein
MAALKAGISIPPIDDARHNLDVIKQLDAAGVGTVWQTAGGVWPDSLTLMSAAAAVTERIRFGTSIVPTYTRHPTVLANQAKVIDSIAPGRLRLGIGTSHRPSIEDRLGIPMGKPLSHLREYVTVLRSLLRDGGVQFAGDYLRVDLPAPEQHRPVDIEVMVAALSVNAFRLAGEIADGAISWVSPVRYLVDTALPALQRSAAEAGRDAPPIVAHVPVAVTTDRDRALEASTRMFGRYGALPFYAKMFEAAGVPPENNRTSAAAIEALTVSGDADAIRSRLEAIVAEGLGEVLVSHVVIDDEASELRELATILAG